MSAMVLMLQGLLLLTIALSLDFTVAQIGVAYGRYGDNLPPPSQVVELYKQYNIQRMRIYDTDPDTLTALQGSDIQLTVGVLHSDLQSLAEDPSCANAWVQDNIVNYPDVKFRYVIVGNEVRPGSKTTGKFAPFVLGAMQNMYDAVSPLERGIKVTTAVGADIIEANSSYPPENGQFRPEESCYIDPIVRFLFDTDAPLFANIYPYFAYFNDPVNINRSYALLDPHYPGVVTPSGTTYKNLYYAIVDAVNAALEKSIASMSFELAADDKKTTEVVGGETGHATESGRPKPPRKAAADADGDDDDNDFASVENARAYVNNLIQAVKTGTPMRPGKPIETYIFAMFDENLKEGDLEEKHFGLFTPDGCPKYPVNFG